jgi:hypothetical protein
MIRLYKTGLSLAQVGEQTGVAPCTVMRCLRERGVPTRDTHGQPRASKA